MSKVSKRAFLKAMACSLPAAMLPYSSFSSPGGSKVLRARSHIFKGDAPKELWEYACEAIYYRKLDNKRVTCTNCPNLCLLTDGDRGICRSRINRNGTLYSIAYGNPCAVNIDPIEKKPLYHFMPATKVFSLAETGCNFRCLNCQNWTISQKRPEAMETFRLFPGQAADKALSYKSQGMAYTYSEASTWYEYMVHTAEQAKQRGLFNLYISNGYINPKPLNSLCTTIDGANINLKAYDDTLYRDLCAGHLEPVLNTLKTLHNKNVHLEITNLVVPGYTDDEEMVKAMCQWIVDTLGYDHPLHFLRFFPNYKLDRLAPTPIATLETMRKIAMANGLRYVYLGNVPGHEANHTLCPACKKTVIRRHGYSIDTSNLKNGKCLSCKEPIPGVWEM